MALLIGTDEAGYGPNLGPLTICGTAWQTDCPDGDLYQLLSDVVSADSIQNRIQVADSKRLYQSTGSIRALELATLSFLYSLTGRIPKHVYELAQMLGLPGTGWERTLGVSTALNLPLSADPQEILASAKLLSESMEGSGCRFLGCHLQALFPDEFNRLIETRGNKAEVLSIETLGVVGRLQRECGPDCGGQVLIGCDKHGGRSRYAGLISQCLTAEFVQVLSEGLESSRYAWNESTFRVEIRFSARGESFLPTALSSMFAKYFRELSMRAWNQFWQVKMPELKPTKGYPVDARRFKNDIAQVQRELGIQDHQIWRCR